MMIGGGLLYIYASKSALYSFLIAFFSSALIILASFKNYKGMVLKRLENFYLIDDRDIIDKIDDPYNLYDQMQEIDENKSLKDIILKEKRELRKNSPPLKEVLKNSAIAFNYIRVGAYLILVAGFFILLKSSNLNLFAYLITLAIPNIIAVIYLLNFAKGES